MNSDHNSFQLPSLSAGYSACVKTILNSGYTSKFTRIVNGPGGVYFACESSVWKVLPDGNLEEYARIRGDHFITGLSFFQEAEQLFVVTRNGIVYQIATDRSGRMIVDLSIATEFGANLICNDIGFSSGVLCVSVITDSGSGLLGLAPSGEYRTIVFNSTFKPTALLVDSTKRIWTLENNNLLVKRGLKGQELFRTSINDDFSDGDIIGDRGSICQQSKSSLFVIVPNTGKLFHLQLQPSPKCSSVATGLNVPTGLCCSDSGSLHILESGLSRILLLTPDSNLRTQSG